MDDSNPAASPGAPAPALPPGVFTQPMALDVPGMRDVRVEADVVAGDGPDAPRLSIYRPAYGVSDRSHPLLVFVPGGPVPAPAEPRAWGIFTSYGRAAVARGFVGVTVGHRFQEAAGVGAAASRLDAALAWLRAHADRLEADADRLAMWAFSGAGTLVAPLIRQPPAGLRALVLFYAALDVRPETLDADPSMRRWSAVSALADHGRWTIPLVVARAGRDAPALNAALDRFVMGALASDAPLDVLTHPTGRHGFDVLDHDARSRDIIARAFEIVRAAMANREA